jgi:hypothetical protein
LHRRQYALLWRAAVDGFSNGLIHVGCDKRANASAGTPLIACRLNVALRWFAFVSASDDYRERRWCACVRQGELVTPYDMFL